MADDNTTLLASAGASDVPPEISGMPAGVTSDPGTLAQGQQTQQQPPRMGGQPLLLQYIQALSQGGKGTVQPGQAQPQRPISRGDATLEFLGQFLSNLSQGLAAAGHGPGANLRGAAGAIQAPYQRELAQYQLGQQQQAQQAQVQSEQASAELKRAQAESQKNVVMTPYGPMNQALAAKVFPAAIQAQGRETAAQIGGAARVQSAQIGQGMMVDVPQELQQQFGAPAKLPLKQLNALEGAANRPLTTIQGANDVYQFNRQTGQKTPLGVGSGRLTATLARPVQVADPNTPGGVKYMPAGEAMRTGATAASSAEVKVPQAVMKDFTSGKSAQTLNAFNTATEHLKLLSQLGDALQNQSAPLINRFGNAYATATGGAAPTSFDMAKNAVAGEVAKTFKGNATEGEIAAINTTINNAQSPAQLKGAINTAISLMESKRSALMEQYNQGIKNTPAFQKKGNSAVDKLAQRYGAKVGQQP